MLATIEISDSNKGNIFMNFGDIELLEAPSITKGRRLVKDFSNPINLQRIKQVMIDEEIEESFSPIGLNYLKSIQSNPSHSRNPLIKTN